MIDHEVAFKHETIVVGSTATGLNPTSGDLVAHRAVITVEAAQLRFRYDGTAPTTTTGHLLNVGDRLILEGRDNIRRFMAIQAGSTSGRLVVTYESV